MTKKKNKNTKSKNRIEPINIFEGALARASVNEIPSDEDMPSQFLIYDCPKKFDELTDEQVQLLFNSVHYKDPIKNLETIFSFVGYDEEGYMIDYGDCFTEELACRFIASKKFKELLILKINNLENKLKLLNNSEEKLYYLQVYLKDINIQVIADPIIAYAFKQRQLREDIDFPEFSVFPTHGINYKHHAGPFRGALLKAEGVALSEFQHHVEKLIEKEKLAETRAKMKKSGRQKVLIGGKTPVTFKDYLLECSKHLYKFLLKEYKGKRGKEICYLLYALNNLHLLDKYWKSDIKQLHICLTKSFGEIGSRQNFNKYIIDLDNPNDYHHKKIKLFICTIEEYKNSFR